MVFLLVIEVLNKQSIRDLITSSSEHTLWYPLPHFISNNMQSSIRPGMLDNQGQTFHLRTMTKDSASPVADPRGGGVRGGLTPLRGLSFFFACQYMKIPADFDPTPT